MGPPNRAIRSDGVRTRAAILDAATRLASVTGLEGLSIGELAGAVGMSKSGLYAHFGSKQDLQLATIQAARAEFIDVVVEPAMAAEEPIDRLRALCTAFLDYVGDRVFPGGCFFVSAAAEFGPRSGPVHDEIALVQQEWTDLLVAAAEHAYATGQLPGDATPEQTAFHLGAVLAGTNVTFILHDDPRHLEQARALIAVLLADPV